MPLNWPSYMYCSQSMITGQLNSFYNNIYFKFQKPIVQKLLNINVKAIIPESFATSPLDQFLLKISCTGTEVEAGTGTELRAVWGTLGVRRTVALPSFNVRWNIETKLGTPVL